MVFSLSNGLTRLNKMDQQIIEAASVSKLRWSGLYEDYTVKSFQVYIRRQGEIISEILNTSSVYNDALKKAFAGLRSGDELLVTDIAIILKNVKVDYASPI